MSVLLRPLLHEDVHILEQFLLNLSTQTKELSTYEYTAQEMCEAINRYDKLRLVTITDDVITSLLEFSFSIMQSDHQRFSNYHIKLDKITDVRFGLCIADEFQNQGLGSLVLPHLIDVAMRFGKKRMILWGGVLAINSRAIRYYKKNGFKLYGPHKTVSGQYHYDGILTFSE